MKIITFLCDKRIHVYMDGCGKIPVRPYFTHLNLYIAREYMKNINKIDKPELLVHGTLLVCKCCGSSNVGITKFVDPNTNEARDDFHGGELNWCFGPCTGETTLVDYIDYVPRIP